MKRVRHKKRGTEYDVIASGAVQTAGYLYDMAPVVVYRNVTDGSVWVRPKFEMNDGRFEEVPAETGFEPRGCPMPAACSCPPRGKFALGQRVYKPKGSSWQGKIVGFYSTTLTPIGYAVESEREPGSVQIYPEAALVAAENNEG